MVVKELQILGLKVIAIETDVTKPINTAVMFRNSIEHYGHLGFISSYPGFERLAQSGPKPRDRDN